jgi:predicted small metal-binding protein
MDLYATCDCGWRCQGSDSEVADQLRRHGIDAHGIELNDDQILAVSRPVTPQSRHERKESRE